MTRTALVQNHRQTWSEQPLSWSDGLLLTMFTQWFTRWSDCGVEPGRWVRSVFWGCIDPRLHSDPVHGADPATGADRTRAQCLHYEISRASYTCGRACVRTCTQSYISSLNFGSSVTAANAYIDAVFLNFHTFIVNLSFITSRITISVFLSCSIGT